MVAVGVGNKDVNIIYVLHQTKLNNAVANTFSAVKQKQTLFRFEIGTRVIRVYVKRRSVTQKL
jgi:hypothetical protein